MKTISASQRSSKLSTDSTTLPEEKRLLLKALYEQGYHKGNAATSLGISRRYLYTQMMRYGVPINRVEMKNYIEKLGRGVIS